MIRVFLLSGKAGTKADEDLSIQNWVVECSETIVLLLMM